MATLIAHSAEASTVRFAKQLAETLGDQRGVTTATEDFSRAGRYVDSVGSVVVVAPAGEPHFHRGARNFMAAHYADFAGKSLFIAALGTKERLSTSELTAMDAFSPRDTAYFRTDDLDETALTEWITLITTRGAA